jgi:hypothetical protein
MPATYGQLKAINTEYDARYWRKIRALYAGGRKLLGDKQVMNDVFPCSYNEEDWVYQERLKRAFYVPYMGALIDFIVAALVSSPIEVKTSTKDLYYEEFQKNVARPGMQRLTLSQFVVKQVGTALQLRRAWCLIDLPQLKGPMPINEADEERMGLSDAYVLPIEPECVRDWEFDESGQLLWAIIHSQQRRRMSLAGDRKTVEEIFTYYDRDHWERYVVSYKEDKEPKESEVYTPEEEGPHSFGKVPLVPLELPEGLWAGGKIESIAVEHFNKRCALSWGMYKSLFQFLAAKLDKSDALIPATEDPNRATNQIIGPGRVWVGGPKDELYYVAPNSDPFRIALDDLQTLRDEMHRVLHQMAMAVDVNRSAAVSRSGLSKQVDQAATAVIMRALGQIGREFATNVVEMVAAGRGELDKLEFEASGGDSFDELSRQDLFDQAEKIKAMGIESPTLRGIVEADVAKAWGVDQNELDIIRDELKRNLGGTRQEQTFNDGIPPMPPQWGPPKAA